MALAKAESARVTARVSPTVQATIAEAAALTGATLNQFLVQSALERAQQIILDERIISLSKHDANVFFEAVSKPAKATKTLKAAVNRYRAAQLNV